MNDGGKLHHAVLVGNRLRLHRSFEAGEIVVIIGGVIGEENEMGEILISP